MNISNYRADLKKYGTIMIDAKDSFISQNDFNKIEKNLNKLPKEFVKIGDAGEKNHVDVSRLMTDIDNPKIVNYRYSKKVLNILNENYLSIIKRIIKKNKVYIRRAQVNFMKKNSFVGYHLDIDSNPDYLYAIILQLGTSFSGGEYIVYKKKKEKKIFKPHYKSIIISDCKIPHEVLKVKKGKRTSFVFFVSNHYKKNKRIYNLVK